PEAQLDRFLFKILVDYPSLQEEIRILQDSQNSEQPLAEKTIDAVMTKEELLHYRSLCRKVKVEEKLLEFIAQIVNKTRNNPNLYLGASPRASLAILDTAKAKAAISGRD